MERSTGPFLSRLADAVRRRRSYYFARKPVQWPGLKPHISFTFDDFPRSAFLTGGAILEKHGIRGSYYASLGFMGKPQPAGDMFTLEDLHEAISRGHEIGCHTFDHMNAWFTGAASFERSVVLNQEAMRTHFPDYRMRTLSYPFCEPHPRNKRIAGKYYRCSRGGGQTINEGPIDLNLLRSCFIDYRTRDDLDYFQRLIEENARRNGWLILDGHDIAPDPTPHGCTPRRFEEIVECAVASSAVIKPVCEVYDTLGIAKA